MWKLGEREPAREPTLPGGSRREGRGAVESLMRGAAELLMRMLIQRERQLVSVWDPCEARGLLALPASHH